MYKPIWKKYQNTFITCFHSIMVEYTLMPFDDFNIKGTMVYGKIGKFLDLTKTFQFFYSDAEDETSQIPLHILGAEKILFDFKDSL